MSDLLTEIYRSHRQGLFSVALAITGSRQQAEDAVHEAFCKLVDRKPPTEDAVPYVFKTVRNAAIPTPRTQQAHQQRAGGGMPDSGHFFVLAFSSSHVRGELWVGVPPQKKEKVRHPRATTAVPVVPEKCTTCHENDKNLPKGEAIGRLSYTVPIESLD